MNELERPIYFKKKQVPGHVRKNIRN